MAYLRIPTPKTKAVKLHPTDWPTTPPKKKPPPAPGEVFAQAAVSHLQTIQAPIPAQNDDVRQRPKRDWTETIDDFTSTTIDWKQTTGPSRTRATTTPPKIKILKEDWGEDSKSLIRLRILRQPSSRF